MSSLIASLTRRVSRSSLLALLLALGLVVLLALHVYYASQQLMRDVDDVSVGFDQYEVAVPGASLIVSEVDGAGEGGATAESPAVVPAPTCDKSFTFHLGRQSSLCPLQLST